MRQSIEWLREQEEACRHERNKYGEERGREREKTHI
jgi:hypothetical protein